MDSDPPFRQTYKTLFDKTSEETCNEVVTVEECELPLVDLGRLNLDESEMEECKREIAIASQEWGFFQVINHGISRDILEKLREEQVKVFRQPFDTKSKKERFPAGSYRWGTPSATCLKQLSWSEAFHIPMTDISDSGAFSSLSSQRAFGEKK
ncbi:gibberellin 2-beta-dioxygenase 8-like [Pistacia vera]|uniref:gibberellin 2-beta-dioxygenase 8-like n=1 Tax=Pistacia vera TaxID=55513 RepID=UPI0012638D96|nr:gibberellin 2-beta-dioxygenase 8-like [Pistacia vera]